MTDTTKTILINVSEKGVQETDKAFQSLNESVDENTSSIKDNEGQQEKYNKTLADSIKDTKVFGVSINSMSSAFKSSIGTIKNTITSFKALKLAIAATGIGALVLILGSLVSFFKRTQAGADILNDALAVIGETVNVILSVLTNLGGALVKVFQGDFKGAAEQAKGALTGINTTLKENIALRKEIELLTRNSDKFQRENLVAIAKLEKNIQEQLLITRDLENTTSQQRLDAIEQARKARERIITFRDKELENTVAIAKKELDLAKSRGEQTDDLERTYLAAIAARIDAETRGDAQIRELQNRYNTERATQLRQQAELDKERREQEAAQIALERQLELAALLEIEVQGITAIETSKSNERVKIAGDTTAAILRLEKRLADDKKKLDQETLEFETEVADRRIELATQLLSGIAVLFGQQSALGKAAATSEAIINTAVASTAIWRDATLPTVAKIGFIAAAVAQGLAAIRQINSTPLPQVQVKESPFGDGGFITGNSHERGGVWLNAEGGEYIINKRAMQSAGVRALVESINAKGQRGGSWAGWQYANGGLVGTNIEQLRLESAIQQQRPVLVLEDFFDASNQVSVSTDISKL